MAKRRIRTVFWRALFLILLSLVPLLTLGWAISHTEASALCGSWWYGLLVPLIVLANWSVPRANQYPDLHAYD